jgi:hypothetical protein
VYTLAVRDRGSFVDEATTSISSGSTWTELVIRACETDPDA